MPSEELDQSWADAQADLSLRWAHSHFVGFVMSQLIFSTTSIKHVKFMLISIDMYFQKEFKSGGIGISGHVRQVDTFTHNTIFLYNSFFSEYCK